VSSADEDDLAAAADEESSGTGSAFVNATTKARAAANVQVFILVDKKDIENYTRSPNE
jgi:hypothetical protein